MRQPAVLILTGDVTPDVERLGALVLNATLQHDLVPAATELEVRFVDRIDPTSFVGGYTDGGVVIVGLNVAQPERVLVHELAHALVGLEHEHDQVWRQVYLTAVGQEFGTHTEERERDRIRWMYDKPYLERVVGLAGIPLPRG